jgi:DNA modification methylase
MQELILNKMRPEHNLKTMALMLDNSIDSIVTDPPYGISFMGQKWDYHLPEIEIWRECLRVLKPGGYLLAFAATRTQHRMAVNIEDAGFEIRDLIAWVYGSGFPKSHNVSKAIDKEAGAERKVTGKAKGAGTSNTKSLGVFNSEHDITEPATEDAIKWAGWGTALKPAFEPITVGRKPIPTTVAANVLKYGTGGLNIDGCRVDNIEGKPVFSKENQKEGSIFDVGSNRTGETSFQGRFPANFIHDGSPEVLACFPDTQSRNGQPWKRNGVEGNCYNAYAPQDVEGFYGDEGSAARFFYCPKVSTAERGDGNDHPTVKPLDLLRYLIRLVTPPGGTMYDPFAGSGSHLIAGMEEGFNVIGSDLDEKNARIFNRRTRHGLQPKMF